MPWRECARPPVQNRKACADAWRWSRSTASRRQVRRKACRRCRYSRLELSRSPIELHVRVTTDDDTGADISKQWFKTLRRSSVGGLYYRARHDPSQMSVALIDRVERAAHRPRRRLARWSESGVTGRETRHLSILVAVVHRRATLRSFLRTLPSARPAAILVRHVTTSMNCVVMRVWLA